MNRSPNPKLLLRTIPLLGMVGLALRLGLYLTAVDEKGLLISNHFLEVMLWLVTAAGAALTVAMVWKLNGSNRYDHNFRPSVAAAVGAFVLAAGILLTVFGLGYTSAFLSRVRNFLGYAAALSLVMVGVDRLRGKRPFFLFHGVVCIFFAIHMVSRYQSWSGNPQLQDYVFDLFSCVCLTLFAYQQASFDAGMGKRRMQLATGLLASFFCGIALANTEYLLMYLAGGIWTVTNLCSLTPVLRRRREAAPESPEE